ncbi:hypothetical protein [Clostridium sp.]|uniref:hypothetical protein n=1 Tax=Clostridium sp. TaxID=1506 RepID=UPI00258AE4E6|nr:hypothetical protein [Clostridium sp.]
MLVIYAVGNYEKSIETCIWAGEFDTWKIGYVFNKIISYLCRKLLRNIRILRHISKIGQIKIIILKIG